MNPRSLGTTKNITFKYKNAIIKEFYDRSYSLINDLNEYQKTLKEDYEL